MSLASVETKSSHKRASWPPLSWGVRFAIAVTGSVIAWWWRISWINGVQIPAESIPGGPIFLAVPLILCSVMSIMLPLWTLLLLTEVLSRSGKWGNIFSVVLLLSFSVWIMNSLLKDWFDAQHSGSLRWLFLIAFIAAILLTPCRSCG